MTARPGMLARGPWRPNQVEVRWREEVYEPPAEIERLADEAVTDLRDAARRPTTACRLDSPAGAPTAVASSSSFSRPAGRSASLRTTRQVA